MSINLGKLSNHPGTEKELLNNRYNSARSNILVMIIFSAINLVLLATNSGIYFLFSASIPYILTDTAMFLCGMYPEEFYTGEFEGMIFADKSIFVIFLIISFIILGVYILCWYRAKTKIGALKTALIFFSIDTVVMIWNYGFTAIIDLAFHVGLIVILAMGINSHKKLQKLIVEAPLPTVESAEDGTIEGETENVIPNSKAMRPADASVKHRVFLEYEAYGHKITYRKVKRTKELVIDGDVYCDYTAIIEMPHMLTATIDGHNFAAGMDQSSHAYINVDGQTAVQKLIIV